MSVHATMTTMCLETLGDSSLPRFHGGSSKYLDSFFQIKQLNLVFTPKYAIENIESKS